MTIEQAEVEAQKKAAAGRALELVRPGTVVGLGSGSTARYFIAGLGDRVRAGLKVRSTRSWVWPSTRSRASSSTGSFLASPGRRSSVAPLAFEFSASSPDRRYA